MRDDGIEMGDPVEGSGAAAGAIEGGGYLRLSDAVEKDGEMGESGGQVGDIASSVQQIDGVVEQFEGLRGVTVDGFKATGFSAQKRLPDEHAMFARVHDPLAQNIERFGRIRIRDGPGIPK